MKVLIMKYSGEYIIAMGDTIDCVPLINWLLKKERLILPVLGHYVKNIRSFFPVNTTLEFAVLNDLHMFDKLKNDYGALEVIASCNDVVGDYQHFEIETLYKQAGLNYAEREKHCTIKAQVSRFPQIERPRQPYAFIPEGGSEKCYRVDRKYVGEGLIEVIPPQDAFMLYYAKIIEHATEIHCHPTSWPRLIEKLPTTGKLFMHNHVRKTNMKPENWRKFNVIQKDWQQIV